MSEITIKRTILAVGLLTFALPAAADYVQAFREGVRAFEKKQWDVAAGDMREAIKLKARSNERVSISGGWNEQYNPYSFLAAALANLGDCEEAHNALRASGLAAGDKNYKATVTACPGYQGGPTPEELRAAKEQTAREQASREQAAKEQAAKEQQARDQQAAKDLQAAKEQQARDQQAREQAAREQQARDNTAREQAAKEQSAKEQAARELAAKEQAAREVAAKEQQAREASARVAESKRALNARITEAKIYVSSNMGDAAARNNLSTAVANAQRMSNRSTQPELDGASATLTKSIATFRAAVTAAAGNDSGTRLKLAIQSYLHGQYQETTSILSSGDIPAGVLRAQAALFRAAARYAAASIAGEKGGEPFVKIAEDLAEYRKMQPGAAPDPRIFSPAFRDFVKQSVH